MAASEDPDPTLTLTGPEVSEAGQDLALTFAVALLLAETDRRGGQGSFLGLARGLADGVVSPEHLPDLDATLGAEVAEAIRGTARERLDQIFGLAETIRAAMDQAGDVV